MALSDEDVLGRLKDTVGGGFIEGYVQRPVKRGSWVRVSVTKESLLRAIEELQRLGDIHITAIIPDDRGDLIHMTYLFSLFFGRPREEVRVALDVASARDDLHFPTLTGLLDGAILYEREAQDLMGVVIDGIPDSRRYILPESFPEGLHPLRKDETGIPPNHPLVKQQRYMEE